MEGQTIIGEGRIGYIERVLNNMLAPAKVDVERDCVEEFKHQIIVNGKRIPFKIYNTVSDIDTVFKYDEKQLLMSVAGEIKKFL